MLLISIEITLLLIGIKEPHYANKFIPIRQWILVTTLYQFLTR